MNERTIKRRPLGAAAGKEGSETKDRRASALERLYRVCRAMDIDNGGKGCSPRQYSTAMRAAARSLAGRRAKEEQR